MDGKKYRLIITGSFDCENFGDLLFPLVLRKYLEDRNVLQELFLFSPSACNMPFYEDIKVYSIYTMKEFLDTHEIDAVIVGGGDLIRLDDKIGKSYTRGSDARAHWAEPVIRAREKGIPVLFNCPGVPYRFHNGNKDFVRTILEQVDYLSVRDEYSREYLMECGINSPIHVSVDTVVGIRQLYPQEQMDAIYQRLSKEGWLADQPYILFQMNESSFQEEHYAILADFLDRIQAETSYKLCFMPIGYEHNDDIALLKLKDKCSSDICFPKHKLHPTEMIALISHAQMFIGSSLHGAIISYAYGTRFMEIMTGFSTKIRGFCRMLGAENLVVDIQDSLWEKFQAALQEDQVLAPLDNMLENIEHHLNEMIWRIEAGTHKDKHALSEALLDLSIKADYIPLYPKVYYDMGQGFMEKHTIYGSELSPKGDFRLRFEVLAPWTAIRFDPVEGKKCLLVLKSAVSNRGNVKILSHNGSCWGDTFFFTDTDPQILLELQPDVHWIELQGFLYAFSDDDGRGYAIEALCQSMDSGQKALEYLEEYRHLWEQKKCGLRNALKDKQLQIKEVSRERQNLQTQCQQLLTEKQELQDQFRQLAAEKHELQIQCQQLSSERERLQSSNSQLNSERQQLQEQVSGLQNRINDILSSTCWKITGPLRGFALFWRAVFSRRTYGRLLKKIYMAFPINMKTKLKIKGAIFKTFSPLLKNTTAYKDWVNYNKSIGEQDPVMISLPSGDRGDYLSQVMAIPFGGKGEEYIPRNMNAASVINAEVKYLAFYLPQYHPFPENDEWWGKGFTEWTNVTKAVPQFVGHYQPRLAGELGYYDLRNKDSIKQQMELAKQYGVYGFCIYYYWFDGKKLMDTPLNLIMENKDLDLPFCLCWANENWSRKWDGKNTDILIAQNYNEEFPEKFIKDIVPYMRDSRYIRVQGKPMLLIYNANEIPNLGETLKCWRNYCREQELGEIWLLAVDFALNSHSREAGFDGFVEFPPHSVYHYGMETLNAELSIIDNNYAGKIFDYGQIVREKKYLQRDTSRYYKGIFLGWDNTARRPQNATVFHRFTIAAFKEWLTDITHFTLENHAAEDRYVFINAWNEWAEGTYLEPDRKYGYAALNTIYQVLKETDNNARHIIYVSHDACYNGAQMLSLNIIEQLNKVFHYEVDVILGGGGVLLPNFQALASNLLCLEQEKEPDQAIHEWLRTVKCKKAMCNTVVTGHILRILHEEGVQCISMIHEMENIIRHYGCEKKLKDIVSYADKVVFASDYVRRSADKIESIPQNKAVVMPQGIYKTNPYGMNHAANRNDLRERLCLPKDTKIVLGVGFGDYRKGLDLFVETAIRVCRFIQNAAFLWVGDVEPALMKNAQTDIETAGLSHRILFPGRSDDVFYYYSACDLFVLTSREDPFPTVVMEAMNAGLPVVAFRDGGGYVENITEATGRLVKMEGWKQMADAVVELLNDDDLRHTMGQQAKAYVDQKFDFIGYVGNLLKLLGESYQKVSVVIPNYNYERYLKLRIDSVINQSYPIYEIILLDDKSSDNSAQIMRQYEKWNPLQIHFYENDVNSGNVFNQWEKGCLLAKGDYVWIAEADDLSKPDFVSRLMEPMADDKDIVLGYTQSFMMDEDGKVTAPNYFCYTDDVDDQKWRKDYVSPASEEISQRLAAKNTIPNVSAVIFKKRNFSVMFEEAKKYHVAGDWAFYVKLLEEGGKVAFVAESLNYHRRHSNSVTTDLKAQTHFEEICRMQDYVCERFPAEVDTGKVMEYRKNVKKILNV